MMFALRALVLPFFAVASTAHAQDTQFDATSSAFRYDGAGRLVGEISPDPDGIGPLSFPAKRTTYDPTGLVVRVETGELISWQPTSVAPNSWPGFAILRTERMVYDTLNQLVRTEVIGAGGVVVSVTQANYDRVGRPGCTAVRMNPADFAAPPASACDLGTPTADGAKDRISRNHYNAAGELIRVQRAVGTPLQQDYATYTYSPNGKQTSMTDARGYIATFIYDGFDRQAAWVFPSKSTPGVSASCNVGLIVEAGGVMGPAGAYSVSDDCEKYSYDRNGNRVRLAKRDGSVLTYSFDNLNRATSIDVPTRANLASTFTRDVYYTYDLRGLQTSARFDSNSGEGSTTDYDGFGRVTATTQLLDGSDRKLTFTYDLNGNRTRITYPDQAYVTYEFDRLNRPTLIQQGGVNPLRSYTYTRLGALDLDTVAGGAAGSNDYDYDPIGRVSAMTRSLSGTTWDNTTAFQYNSASQISREERSNDLYLYTGRQNGTLNYDTNGLNQYQSISGNQYCHDANGNLTADGEFIYLYDVENRLVEKRVQTNNTCTALAYEGQLKAQLLYDPLGRLYQITGETTGTTRFLIDGNAMVGEYSDTGTLLRRYVHGSNGEVDDPIGWYEGAAMGTANARLLFANQQGSIVAPVDMSGTPLRLFKYDEYGVAQASDSSASGALVPANGARFLYTGQAWLPELGLYYYKARIYSPRLGRFMQTDPIGYEDQVNLYAYVGNDPLNRTDPSGMCSWDPYCSGSWSEQAHSPSETTVAGFEKHFMSGEGLPYYFDPVEMGGLEGSIDIGRQIQTSVSNPNGRMRGIVSRAIPGAGPTPFQLSGKANTWSFNPSMSNEAALTVGRFTGNILNGTVSVDKSGVYTITGTLVFDAGRYDFTPDGDGLLHNAAIAAYGAVLGEGQGFMPISTRTYEFTTKGRFYPSKP